MHPKSRGPMPPEFRAIWEAEYASFDRKDIDAQFAQTEAAAQEATFSGFLRRCIHRHGRPIAVLAQHAGVDHDRLLNFLRGVGPLESGEIDKLLDAIGLELLAAA